MKECVTHHNACDCREARFKEERDGLYAQLIGQEHKLGTLYEVWRAKAEKLEAENATLHHEFKMLQAGAIRMSAENKRYRKALELIASWCQTPEDPDACGIAECKVARQALEEKAHD